jgi:hypothetical protein
MLFVMFIVGLHTSTTFYLGPKIPIPLILCAIAAVASQFLKEVRVKWAVTHPLTLFCILSFCLNIVLLDTAFAAKYYLGFIQLVYSIIIAVCAYRLTLAIPQNLVAKASLAIIGCVAFLSVAELDPSVRTLFFEISASLDTLHARNIAQLDHEFARDLTQHGAIRSMALALEPSHAAITLLVVSYCLFWTGEIGIKRYLIWLVFMLICMWAIRSPIILIAILGPSISFVALRRGAEAIRQLFGALATLCIVTAIMFPLISDIFMNRFEKIIDGDGSFIMRVSAPIMLLSDKLLDYALVGIGVVGNLDMLASEIVDLYYSIGITYIDIDSAGGALTNCLVVHFLYFGVTFGVIALFLLIKSIPITVPRLRTILIFQICSAWIFCGGYTSPRIWIIAAILSAATRHKEASHPSHSAWV